MWSPTLLLQSVKNFFLVKRHWFFFAISFIVCLTALYTLDQHFRIADIVIVGQSNTKKFIGLPGIAGKRIWLLNTKQLQKQLGNVNANYAITKIQKTYPSTLTIYVKMLFPAAYLQVGNGYFLLSKEGLILNKERSILQEKLPVISYYQTIPFSEYQSGMQIEKKDVQDALYFQEVLKSMHEKVISIDIVGYHMLRLSTEIHAYFFSSEKERSLQRYQFNEAIKQFQVEGTKYAELDFRFDKPIVKF